MEFGSAEEIEEALRCHGIDQPTRQLERGPFTASLAMRSTEQAELFVDRYNKGISITLKLPSDTVGLLLPRIAKGRFVSCGEEMSNGSLIVFGDGSQLDITASGLFGTEGIGITKARFTTMFETLCPASKFINLERPTVIQSGTAQLQALREAVVEQVRYLQAEPTPEYFSNVLAAAITAIGVSLDNRGCVRNTVGTNRTRVAKLAQEFIEANYRQPVRIEDLCRITNVSARSLQRCFRAYFDVTISDYLKTVRLNAAHRALIAAHPLKDTVARIAVNHGSSHLGRFSTEFHKHFGQLPREVLAMR